MSTDVTTPITFEQRLKDRIREDIGRLITEEELKKIIDRSMEELFFVVQPNPAWEKLDTWRRRDSGIPEKLPSLAHSLAMELVKPMLQQAITQWVLNNQEKIVAQMKLTFEDELPKAIFVGFQRVFIGLVDPSIAKLQSQMAELMSKGLVRY